MGWGFVNGDWGVVFITFVWWVWVCVCVCVCVYLCGGEKGAGHFESSDSFRMSVSSGTPQRTCTSTVHVMRRRLFRSCSGAGGDVSVDHFDVGGREFGGMMMAAAMVCTSRERGCLCDGEKGEDQGEDK